MDKEQRRRNYEAKRLYEEKRFRKRIQETKPQKQKQRRLRMKDILDYEYNEDLPSDV